MNQDSNSEISKHLNIYGHDFNDEVERLKYLKAKILTTRSILKMINIKQNENCILKERKDFVNLNKIDYKFL